jgi:murein DD-endopeptidase MepM/ murein hydrolase activator NlpD
MAQGQVEGGYAFAQQPRAVSARKKFRDPAGAIDDRLAVNIMWDRRVVRGNTYAAQVLPATAVPDPVALQKDAEKRKLQEMKKRQKTRTVQRPATPDAVAGRKHMDVQTENFLEEISDRPQETEVETQTDAFMDRPPSPLYIPKKTGLDKETQIYEGDLFDFDFEVEPILQVLVGKTLEQGLMEVLEEEELANLRAHQDEYDQIRAAELAEAQRMEAAETRRAQEKERRIKQERERVANERTVAKKVAARGFSHRYIGDVVSDVFGNLEGTGFFYDPLVKEIEDSFVPWLLDGVSSSISGVQEAQNVMDASVIAAMELSAARKKAADDEYHAALAAEAKAKKDAEDAAAAAKAAADAEAAAAAAAEGTAEGEGDAA